MKKRMIKKIVVKTAITNIKNGTVGIGSTYFPYDIKIKNFARICVFPYDKSLCCFFEYGSIEPRYNGSYVQPFGLKPNSKPAKLLRKAGYPIDNFNYIPFDWGKIIDFINN